jgi:hypothetical protein
MGIGRIGPQAVSRRSLGAPEDMAEALGVGVTSGQGDLKEAYGVPPSNDAFVGSAPRGVFDTRWAVVAVLAAAAFTRFFMVGRWSLWLDEETSLYFSQHLTKSFATHAPVFFMLLRGLFEVTGVSVIAGRILAASLGVLSILLAYLLAARFISRPVGVLAAAFLVLSVGHLFWSQSIRYYILLLVFQIVSVYLFFDGFERNKPRQLALVSVFLLLGTLSHLSVALLFPVFPLYLAWTILAGDSAEGFTRRGYIFFAIPFVLVTAVLLLEGTSFRSSLSPLIMSAGSGQPRPLIPTRVLERLVIYFGAPAVLLSLAAPFVGRGIVPSRPLRFFTLLAVVPLLVLLVVRTLRVAWPLWYQGFVALIGVAILAAVTLYSLRQRGYIMIYRLALVAVLALSLPLIYSYYTSMHGDRARVKEAVEFVRVTVGPQIRSSNQPLIYSTDPGVTAFYLGYDPSETMTQLQVKRARPDPPAEITSTDWFILESGAISSRLRRWLVQRCELAATFEAHSGPRDRTVWVYRSCR